jgi:hypothetical protein
MMLIKVHEGNVKQLSEKGEGVAVISTLNVKDKDGDVTLPGAFGEQFVPVVPAHNWGAVPLGKAKIVERGNEAVAEFSLNLNTGRDWYEHLKFDLAHPPALQQWSYGFSIPKDGAKVGGFEGQTVRFLKQLTVHEVSLVLLGAGVDTRTVALKGLWLTTDQVKLMCPPCAEKMRERHITKIKLSELIKQGFTCPKPFASFQECVDRFSGEADVDDPEEFCAAWEAACGERGADGDGQKTLADHLTYTVATLERLEAVNDLRLKDGRELSPAHQAKIADMVERLNRILRVPLPKDLAQRYFDMKARIVKGLDPR